MPLKWSSSSGSPGTFSTRGAELDSLRDFGKMAARSTAESGQGEEKVIQALVGRIVNKLPSNSGKRLAMMEVDSTVQTTVQSLLKISRIRLGPVVHALASALETLSKHTAGSPLLEAPLDILHSQLFLLHLLLSCLSFSWRLEAQMNPPPPTELPRAWPTPHPLDDALARYLLAVILAYIRMLSFDTTAVAGTSSPAPSRETKSATASSSLFGRSFVSTSTSTFKPLSGRFLQQHSYPSAAFTSSTDSFAKPKLLYPLASDAYATITQMVEYVSRITFFLSASNWPLVIQRVKTRIKQLTAVNEEAIDLSELRLLEWSALDRPKLGQMLQEISSNFLHIKPAAQIALAIVFRHAVWSWIEMNPIEYENLVETNRKLDGGPDTLFDVLHSMSDSTSSSNLVRVKAFYPLMADLLILSPDVLKRLMMGDTGPKGSSGLGKKQAFLDSLRKGLLSPKTFNACANCYLDLMRASVSLSPRLDNAGVRRLVADTYNDLKRALFSSSLASESSDLDLLIDALIALYRTDPNGTLKVVYSKRLHDSSDASKIVVVKACLRIFSEAGWLYWYPSLQLLRDEVAPGLRAVLQACATSILAGRDKQRKDPPASQTDLICALLELFALEPLVAFTRSSSDSDTTHGLLETVASLAVQPSPTTVRAAATKFLTAFIEALPRLITRSSQIQDQVAQSSSALWRVLVDVSRQALFALHSGDPIDVEKSVAAFRNITVELYRLTDSLPELLADLPLGLTATIVASSASMISLSWPDVEQGSMISPSLTALAGLVKVAHKSQLARSSADDTDEARDAVRQVMIRIRVLEEIAILPSATGRQQQQRTLRKAIRPYIRPAIVPTSCWLGLVAYCRNLTARIISADADRKERDSRRRALSADIDGLDEDESKNWQNIIFFLCATANSVMCDGPPPQALADLVGKSMLPKAYDESNDPLTALEAFLRECVDLLICHSVHVRETVKDALGTELPPSAYRMLISQMTQLLSHAVGPTGMTVSDPFTIFAEQVVLVLRLAIDRLQHGESAGFAQLELGELLFLLAQYVQKLGRDDVALRLKLRFCQLTEAALRKSEMITLTNGIAIRNAVLEWMSGWFSSTARDSDFHHHQLDGSSRLQRELDHACLRAMVPLSEGLTLRAPGDDGENPVVKSRIFYRHLSQFVEILERGEGSDDTSFDSPSLDSHHGHQKSRGNDDSPALAIAALSNLLAANIDVGLKHCLALAYHEEPALRVAFMQLLTNILRQGARFGGLSAKGSGLPSKPYLDLFADKNLAFVMAVTEACPSNEIDEISLLVFRVFEANGQLLGLMRALLQREVAATNHEADLLRANSITTRIMTIFGKTYGYNYCKSTLQPLLNSLLEKPAECSFELDPTKAGPDEDIERNADRLRLMCQALLDLICSSSSPVPVMIRALCNIIWEVVETRYPESRHSSVGSFIFLRFFCPAIVAPENMDLDVPADVRDVRRALLLITKVVQNLANNVAFGGREPHMKVLNSFLSENIRQVTKYLSELAAKPSTSELQRAIKGYQDEAERMLDPEGDDSILHAFAYRHIGKLETILSSMPPSYRLTRGVRTVRGELDGKLALDQLKARMESTGTPSHVAPLSSSARSQVYDEFMKQNRGRKVDNVATAFYEGPASQNGRRIFYFVVSRVALVDYDLLAYHIFQILDNITDFFDLVIDLTEFSPANELPLTWLKRSLQMCPAGILPCVNTLALYNPNSHAKRRIRRLISDLSSTVPSIGKNVVAASSPAELAEIIPFTSLALPEFTMALAYEADHVFTNLLTLTDHQQQVPVVVKLGYDCLQVASWRKQDITTAIKAYVIDVIRLKDIEDISIGNGPTSEHLVIRHSQNELVTFITRKRGDMAQIIRTARAKIRDTPSSERTLRPSDVPGTLLNVALLNLCSSEESLRAGAYDLVQELCQFFKYDLASRMLHIGAGLHIPSNSLALVMDISRALAGSVPQLTLDFLKEWSIGFSKADIPQKTACLFYVGPWLSNLDNCAKPSREGGVEMIRAVAEIVRGLVNVTATEKQRLNISIYERIWKPLTRAQDALVDVMINEILHIALDAGMASEKTECVADILVSISSIAIRGKVIAKLRKLLAQTYLKPSATLADNAAWADICTLARLNAALAFNTTSSLDTQLFLPELFHIITLLTGVGSVDMRQTVYGLLVNVVQSLAMTPASGEGDGLALQVLLRQCQSPEMTACFGLRRVAGGLELTNVPAVGEGDALLQNAEQVASLLGEIMSAAAVSMDCGNAWRARWMGLVVATCFQHNPATQPQAFTVLGFLARDEVDEDLVYQILVAMSTTLSHFTEADHALVVSMLRCLTRIVPGLLPDSRYAPSLFWIALGVLQLGYIPLFAGALQVMLAALQSVVLTSLPGQNLLEALLEAKKAGGEAGRKLDQVCGVNFETSIGFALVGVIFKGVRHPSTRKLAVELMIELLKIAAKPSLPSITEGPVTNLVKTGSVPFFMALLPVVAGSPNELIELFLAAGMGVIEVPSPSSLSCYEMLDLPDNHTALLLVTFVTTVLSSASSDIERVVLYRFIADAAADMPEVISMAYDTLIPRMTAVLGTTTNVSVLDSITRILERAISDPNYSFPSQALASNETQSTSTHQKSYNGSISSSPSMTGIVGSGAREAFLEDLGMNGLAELGFPSVKMDRVAPMAKWVAALIEAFTI
ncbi:hypothetical protein BCR39DRAFT_533800 [Naematelia encephala]|uniref:Ras-GAP domain-containing protein n=1 Tax=Naematelia encephala TaxID=71784 RepID=A0A1Y2B3W4_9TREE|nr:hypothetical protein BCR39DRAFT_533800 [Naematelia encephala]